MLAMIEQDQTYRLFPATPVVRLLQLTRASYELPAVVHKVGRYNLRLIEDISYLRRNVLDTTVLCELICHRYERKSLL